MILVRTVNSSQLKTSITLKNLKDWNAKPVFLKMKQPKQITVNTLKKY